MRMQGSGRCSRRATPHRSIRSRWAADTNVKNGVLILILAIALAVGGYSIYYRTATKPAAVMLLKPEGEMDWLKLEYHLSDEQFARIQQLHREYAPNCDLMCDKITI